MSTRDTASEEGPWTDPIRIILLSIWFALLASWMELAIVADRIFRQHRPLFGMAQRLSLWRDVRLVWIVPLVDVAILLLPALVLALLARRRPGRPPLFLAVFLTVFLGTASVLFNFTWLHRVAVLVLAAGVAVQAGRMVSAHRERFHGLVRRTLGGMIVLIALAGTGGMAHQAWKEHQMMNGRPPADRAPNVLLLILDTVRASSLSLYGYDRPTTPHLARLAQRGVRFDRAYATAPWTFASHASFFTGHLPHELTASFTTPLDNSYPTLAEAMLARGYATAGFVANTGWCSRETGLPRGFAHYEDFVLSTGQLLQASSILRVILDLSFVRRALGYYDVPGRKNAARINHDFLGWLSQRDERRPFFAFLNFDDAHYPYLPPAPYDTLYGNARALARRLHSSRKGQLTPATGLAIRDVYDGALTYLDERLGGLFDELERRGTLKNTIVIITSDHGEQFGEHGLFQHGNSLYTQLLHVPFLIFGTEAVPAGVSVPAPVSLRDLPATILDLIGVDGPSPFPGRSMRRYWAGTPPENRQPETVAAELGRTARLMEFFAPDAEGIRAILAGRFHFIKFGRSAKTGLAAEELYDVDADPEERDNVIHSPPGEQALEHFRSALDSILPPVPGPGEAALPSRDGVLTLRP